MFSGKEFALYAAQGLGLTVLIAWFFYRSLWAVLPLLPLAVLFLRRMQERLGKDRREKLALQFRDLILAAAAGLQAGYSMENAFLAAGEDVERLHGTDSLIAGEMRFMRRGIRNNIPLEQLLLDLGRRSGVGDVEDFAEVFSIAKRSGGAVCDMIRRSAAVTGDKIEISGEIRTLLASRKYEQKIMNLNTRSSVLSAGHFQRLFRRPVRESGRNSDHDGMSRSLSGSLSVIGKNRGY